MLKLFTHQLIKRVSNNNSSKIFINNLNKLKLSSLKNNLYNFSSIINHNNINTINNKTKYFYSSS